MTRVRAYTNSISAALVTLALAASPCIAQWTARSDTAKSNLVEKIGSGEIDWGGGYYYASGESLVPSPEEEPNRARALLKAKGYAKMRAVADLRMAIDGTAVSHRAAGRDCITRDADLRQTIEGYVANVEIVSEQERADGSETSVVVTVRAPMFGANGVGSAIVKSRSARDLLEGRSSDFSIERRGDAKASTIQPSAKGPFTSLIVDCSGFEVWPAISPRIRRADGSEVWGTMSVDPDVLQARGTVGYARTVDDARRNPRAGSNPLILKAIGRAGGRHMCDAVISDADADRTLQENISPRFLDKCNVLFVVDGS